METLHPTPSISFGPSLDRHQSSSTSRTPSCVHSVIETPYGPIRRAHANVTNASSPVLDTAERNWPSGWRPYACLLGGFLLMFNSWGLVNAYGTFASYYMQHLLPGRDILLFNLVGSTQSFIVLVLSAPVGRFLDAGYSRHLIVTGTVLVSLGMFLLSVVNGDGGYNQGNYGLVWLTQGFITGLGMACFFVSSSQVVATWFPKRKSFAIGIVASGASIAGLAYPMMTKYLIAAVRFNDAVRYVSAAVTATAILAIIVARPNPDHPLRKPDRWLKLSVFVDKSAARNVPFVWLCVAISFLFFGFYAVFFNLEEWAAARGFGYKDRTPISIELPHEVREDAIRTFWLLSIMNACSTLGRLGASYLSDRLGALHVHAVVTYVAALLVLLLWTMANSVPATLAFVVVFGAFSGAVIGLPPASVAHILGPEGSSRLGHYTGMMYTCSSIFALTGPVIAGHLITKFGTYLTVQLWSGFSMFLSAGSMSVAIYYMHRSKAATKASDEEKFPSDSLRDMLRSTSNSEPQSSAQSRKGSIGESEIEKDAISPAYP